MIILKLIFLKGEKFSIMLIECAALLFLSVNVTISLLMNIIRNVEIIFEEVYN